MYNFILQTIVMVSLGTMIYLVARTLPRVDETVIVERKNNYIDKLIKRIPLEKADAFVSMVMEKFLRKFKVLVLKLDNLLTKHLQNLRPQQGTDKMARPNIFEKKDVEQ